MTTLTPRPALSRSKLRLVAALLAVSTVLFVMGVAVERGWGSSAATTDIHQEAGASREAQEGAEATHNEAQETTEAREAQEHADAAEPTIAGLDLESPWLVGVVVLLTLLLIVALLRFGYPVLVLVLIVAALATIADVREVVVQLAQAQNGVALLATGVALSRLATAIVALLALREARTAGQTPAAVS